MQQRLMLVSAVTGAMLWAGSAVPLRSRVQLWPGQTDWQEVETSYPLDPRRTAIVVCDMWDKHWCKGATARVGEIATRMEAALQAARRAGVLIIHAPSETMPFYKDYPQRLAIQKLPRVAPASPLELKSPPVPVDSSDGGCDTPGDTPHQAWSRQHPGLTIAEGDLISDNGDEIYSALQAHGRTDLLVMGVHTNMCILNRTFAIKEMTKRRVRCILVRDLTDAMYDPNDHPFVSHERGTELVIEHIERYWAPSVLSKDLLSAWR